MFYKHVLFVVVNFFVFFSLTALSNDQLSKLSAQAQRFSAEHLAKYPNFEYPVKDPQLITALFPDEKAVIFGYGSLVNKTSAARTLSPEVMSTYKPVLAFGLKRLFNYKVGSTGNWGTPERPTDLAMLNVFKTGNMDNMVNGVTFEVPLSDLRQLIKREIGYDLVAIPVIAWDDKGDNPHFFVAYTFSASSEQRDGKSFISPCINPVPGYARASRDGAAAIGKEFLDFWVKTTYLADKKTSFKDWENHPGLDVSLYCKELSYFAALKAYRFGASRPVLE